MSCNVNRPGLGLYTLQAIKKAVDYRLLNVDDIGLDVSSSEAENIQFWAKAAVEENPECYGDIANEWDAAVRKYGIDVVTENQDAWNFDTDQFIKGELKELADTVRRNDAGIGY